MSTKYQMWFTYNAEKEKIQIPVFPEKLSIKSGSKNESMNVTGLGEVTIMQSRPALQISFSSFFPAKKFPGLQVKTITKPLTLVNKIKKWQSSKKPIHFIVTACGVDLYTTIEDFSYYEQGGDPGTYYYSVTLKEYREITTRKVKINVKKSSASVSKKKQRVNNSTTPSTYKVKTGDCLWNIAKKFYGNGALYTKIYNANKSVIGGNPNLIYAGQVLKIP